MVIRRSESAILNEPASWEYHEVAQCFTWVIALAGEHCENRRIWVFFADASDYNIVIQVVFTRGIIAIPSYHVECRVVHFGLEEAVHEFRDYCESTIGALFVLVASYRILEIFRVSETVGSYRTCAWQFEMSLVDLTSIASCDLSFVE